VANVVHVVDEDAPEHYARAVTDLIQNPDRMQTLRDLSQAWIREHSYPAMAQRLAGLLTTDPTRTEHIAVTAAHHTLEHR
jgi:hypothetical protein